MTSPSGEPTTTPGRAPAGRHLERLLGGPGRVAGVDVARGIAVLGMFTAHVGFTSDDLGELSGWLSVSHGRSSILFALVAGVSLALVSGREKPLVGLPALQVRTRLLVRSALLLGLVALLDLLGTRVLLILGFYAAYFVLALPFLRWSPRRLLGLAVALGVVGPLVTYWGAEALARWGLRLPRDGSGAVTDFLVTGHYPAAVWMAYVLAGMAIGRCDLTSPVLRSVLLTGGLTLGVACTALSTAIVGSLGGADDIELRAAGASSLGSPRSWSDPWPTPDYLWLAGPHTDTSLEVFGSGGFAVAVLGLCLFVGRLGSRVLAPVAAVGAMALTVYSLQIVVIWRWGPQAHDQLTNTPLLWLVVASLAFATVWRWALGRGPIERLFAEVAARASSLGGAEPAPRVGSGTGAS
ncbi:heparan-alpha-glucosaminide N-acetyltransferase domain-containing protein [Oerskovia flava]|uniref:heparan-alpha-glucosaminide N-acetyltransferase domain-containing protein n=1 Tax=Oerskovia flava TaxID=2986422 RepID=UPI00223FB5E4|nr:heparan-alpha-glucosaminide N-acetyltransferase domain-containing protein [Oerskovia sp. JB1-3-2]